MTSTKQQAPRARPTLEALESRLVLDNTSFVHNVYHDLLNRLPDSAGSFWVAKLNNGYTRQLLATFFWQSVEHRQLEVTSYYQTYLGRAPDPVGNSNIMAMLRAGATELSIQITFLASNEFRLNHADNQLYTEALFSLQLHRQPSQAEIASYVNTLNSGVSLVSVASTVTYSLESFRLIAVNDYMTYLGRSTDNAGRDFWANQLTLNGGNIQLVAQAFISSDEYFGLAPK